VFQKSLSDLSEDSFFLHICHSLIIDISPLLGDFYAGEENNYVGVLALD
jgi:hypothetical protein